MPIDRDTVETMLKTAGLRPTRQRLALGETIWSKGHCHFTAESLHRECLEKGVKVSMATVYNTLHQLTESELLREIVVEGGRSYFDTNIDPHHHFFNEDSGHLSDIPYAEISVNNLPPSPEGSQITGVEVIVRIKPTM